MLHLLYFILACWGATALVTMGDIFAGFRRFTATRGGEFLGGLVSCPQCLGFWVGIGFAFAFSSPEIAWRPLEIVALGCISSGACYLIMTVVHALGGGWVKE